MYFKQKYTYYRELVLTKALEVLDEWVTTFLCGFFSCDPNNQKFAFTTYVLKWFQIPTDYS